MRTDKLTAPNQVTWRQEYAILQVFDQLIYNTDRNLGNLVITTDWRVWMIDHTRAFRPEECVGVLLESGAHPPRHSTEITRELAAQKRDEEGIAELRRGELDAAVEGEAAKIAFNGKYLQEVLQVLDGGQVALETSSPSSPGVIKPVGTDNYIHVVMPMFVQW